MNAPHFRADDVLGELRHMQLLQRDARLAAAETRSLRQENAILRAALTAVQSTTKELKADGVRDRFHIATLSARLRAFSPPEEMTDD